MNNKNIFAENLKRQMQINNKTRRQICGDLGISYYTFSDWVNGKKYPRMDKVEMLANYFNVLKSDLIEEKTEERREMQKNNDILTDIVVRMRTDDDFADIVKGISQLTPAQLASVKQVVDVFLSTQG